MTFEDRRVELMFIAAQFCYLRKKLELLRLELEFDFDQQATDSIICDLFWAEENCLVMADHQVGKSLDDTMGY